MFSYETGVRLPSLSWAKSLKLTSKGLETFSSCLLYTCETVHYNMVAVVKREHRLSGQRSLSAHWTAQNQRPSLSTRGWAGESSRQCISRNLQLLKFHAHLGQQKSNHGQCGTASSVVPKDSLCTVFAAALQNFSYEQVCIYIALIPRECKFKGNNYIHRVLWSLAQLYTFI